MVAGGVLGRAVVGDAFRALGRRVFVTSSREAYTHEKNDDGGYDIVVHMCPGVEKSPART